MKVRDIEINVVKADITSLEVDAIVNPANNELLMGGGLAGVIKKNGGHAIQDEALIKAPIAVGKSVATGAGSLPIKYVIHAVTMGMNFETNEHHVRQACRSAIECAKELGLTTLAIPALGCGVGRFPLISCAKILTQEALCAAREGAGSLKEIVLCLYEAEAFDIFEKHVYGYLNHIMIDLAWGPYVTADIIIEVEGGVVLIERTNPPLGWALPGGFVDRGESLEKSARREAKEETNLDLEDLKQFHTYSDPGRDPRFHTVTTVFTAKGVGTPQAGDDAKAFKIVALENLTKIQYAFDHNKVIEDYLKSR